MLRAIEHLQEALDGRPGRRIVPRLWSNQSSLPHLDEVAILGTAFDEGLVRAIGDDLSVVDHNYPIRTLVPIGLRSAGCAR